MRVPYPVMKAEFKRVLLKLQFTVLKADTIAGIFADNSLSGVYSHGLNRFPGFVDYVKAGYIDKDAEPVKVKAMGGLEQWDGCSGPGVLNARFSMNRTMELAAANGIGSVALKNTNHWMRGGTYGLQAAVAGYIGICFTNTIPLLPPWGSSTPRLGNNPLVIAVPGTENPIVLDMAVSQYSMGKLQQYKTAGDTLPIPGGYNHQGELTTDPAEILDSGRVLPVGFWKGAGLSLLLDLVATLLSEGSSTADLSKKPAESGVSQIFICIRTGDNKELQKRLTDQIIAYTRSGELLRPDVSIRYPGENMHKTLQTNRLEGIPVEEAIWNQVLAL
jgi:3-dehydro-L-gulonate 2-dehydrogenase